jgi:hypothetical protein
MLVVAASCAQQHVIYLIVAWLAIIAIPLQLSLKSLRWLTFVVSLFTPLQYDIKNVVLVAHSSWYDMKNRLVNVVTSCNQQFAYRNGG